MSKRRRSFASGWDTPSEGTTSASSSSDDDVRHRDAPVPRKRVHLDNGQERRFAHMSIYSHAAGSGPASARPVHTIHPTAVEEVESPPVSPCMPGLQGGGAGLPHAEEVHGATHGADADAGVVGEVEEPHDGDPAGETNGEAMDQSTSRGGSWYDLDKNRVWVQSLSDTSDSGAEEEEPGEDTRQEGGERKYTVLPGVLARLDRKYRERMARRRAGHEDEEDDRRALVPYRPQAWPVPPHRPERTSAAPGPGPADTEEAMMDDTPTASPAPQASADPEQYGTQGPGWTPNPQFNMPIYGLGAPSYTWLAQSQPQAPTPPPQPSVNPPPSDDAAMELD